MSNEMISRLTSRAAEADGIISVLRHQVADMRQAKLARARECLTAENAKLVAEVEALKSELIQVEISNGLNQIKVAIPIKTEKVTDCVSDVIPPIKATPEIKEAKIPVGLSGNNSTKKSPAKKERVVQSTKGAENAEVIDFGRLDLRVGIVLSAKKHPDADSLYIEEVDVGEEKNRTVVSGLVRFIPLLEMQNRPAVFLCNLKPASMRGVLSEAMIMCASTPDNVEVLRPPRGCTPGQRVLCEGYATSQPDKQLNPKKKIFEKIAPDLKTDGDRAATYKGVRWTVDGVTGHIVADTLANVNIK